jgi:L-ascorbate metabolism protein UlaG (beta-lactamase superfamily)
MTARITYVGHATVRIELAGTTLLTDPILRDRVFGFIRRSGPAPDPSPPPDAVLLSHQHPDHLDPRSLRMLGTDVTVISARGSGRRLGRHGFADVREVDPGETVAIGEVDVRATPADHDGRRYPIGRMIPALGFEIRGADARIYFAGDTDLFDEMAELAGVDVALLPIAGWGPTVGKGHIDPERAIEAVSMLRPRVVIPIHWGTLLRTDLHGRRPELLTTPADELRSLMARAAPQVQVEVLDPGESLLLES